MSDTRIKICGLRVMQDVEIVNEAMPDYAGFIFDPARKRYIRPEEANLLRKFLKPEIRTVGVFVNPSTAMVLEYLSRCPVQIVQLHGQESNAWIEDLRSQYYDFQGRQEKIRIVKAYTIRGEDDLAEAAASAADLVLLDHGSGGTGESFDWTLVRDFPRPFALAGGLNPGNVREAIRLTHPFAVDTSSGVEGPDGHKDREKVLAFIRTVRGAGV